MKKRPQNQLVKNRQDRHNRLIQDQFTKQAVPFTKKVPAHSNEAAFKLIIKTAGIGPKDHVLDVACGPGMLTCAVAQKAGTATGIDLVPAMLKQARLLQKEKKLKNLDWKIGDVTRLPFADRSFSAVITRFSFHHFLDPQSVLREMVRTARPGGTVCVVDVLGVSPEHALLHDTIEKLRDNSHVKVYSIDQLKDMARKAGLGDFKQAHYQLEIALEQQLSASFFKKGNGEKIRNLVATDKAGLVSRREGNNYYLVYPIVILAWRKDKKV